MPCVPSLEQSRFEGLLRLCFSTLRKSTQSHTPAHSLNPSRLFGFSPFICENENGQAFENGPLGEQTGAFCSGSARLKVAA
jgi:hypothetical protein